MKNILATIVVLIGLVSSSSAADAWWTTKTVTLAEMNLVPETGLARLAEGLIHEYSLHATNTCPTMDTNITALNPRAMVALLTANKAAATLQYGGTTYKEWFVFAFNTPGAHQPGTVCLGKNKFDEEIYLVVNANAKKELGDFLDWCRQDKAQEIVMLSGLVPIPHADRYSTVSMAKK